MSSLCPDFSLLCWSNRLRRFLLPEHRFPRDWRCGYPVFRGWDRRGADEVVRRFRPDIVVVQSTHPAPLLQAFAPHGLPIAIYLHEVEELDHFRALARLGMPFLTNSAFTAQRLLDRCGIASRVILPLIDRQYYATATRPEHALFINTVPRKGLELAFAMAHARPDIPFDFVMSWILKPDQVKELHRRAGAARNITLHAPMRDMRRLYQRARVLLVPSQWEETWGRVVTEAHINGIPVIASDRGGLPQSVGPGGLIVTADAPAAQWSAALGGLWDDPKAHARYSSAALAYSRRPEVQPDAIVEELLGFLSSLATKRSTGVLSSRSAR